MADVGSKSSLSDCKEYICIFRLMNSPENRMHVVDALRGFAIVAIMLLHNLEHFDYYYFPENLPDWINSLDKSVWSVAFFLFSGKAYAIFSLLFGLTFWIQSNNQEKQGRDFRGRFAWRLLLLFGLGMINTAFYEGDILSIYAVIGLVLIPIARLSNRVVLWIALFLLFQPYEWSVLIQSLINPDRTLPNPASWGYYAQMENYLPGSSMLKTWVGNLTTGKMASITWSWENGRLFQTASLFMLGMLAGRRALFLSLIHI